MYQLLCHVNVPAPADTCLTRTADRAILDFVPVMKRTVDITIQYYDNFKEFGTIPVRDRYRYQVIHQFYLQFPTGKRREADAETAAIFNANDVGRTGPRAQDVLFRESLYCTLVPYIILQNCVF